MSDIPLEYVRRAITGEIDAIVPHASLIEAQTVLSSYYVFSNELAARLMQNFMDAKRIYWYDGMPEPLVRTGFTHASDLNIGAWDGYYAEVAIEEGAKTILTIDDDFERLDGVAAEVVLSPDEFAALTEYIER